jgi:hypothetical protein
MIPLGFAENLEHRRRAAAKIVRKTEPPREDAAGFLPTVADVVARLAGAAPALKPVGPVGHTPDPPSQAPAPSDTEPSDAKSDAEPDDGTPTSEHTSDQAAADLEPTAAAPIAAHPTSPTANSANGTAATSLDGDERALAEATTETTGGSDTTLVLIERHTAGPHSIELWGPPPDKPPAPTRITRPPET